MRQDVWPWQEVYERIQGIPHPLTIRLVLCQKCGFLFYGDTFSFDEMKQLYEEEARYARPKQHQLKPGRQWELERLIGFMELALPGQDIKLALDLGAGDFVALDRIAILRPDITFEALDPSYPNNNHNTIKVYRTMLEDYEPSQQYDLITAIHILEHVGDLNHFMTKVSALAKHHGYLYVEVPFQVGPGLLRNSSASAQHINYFTPFTLRYLLTRSGFTVCREEFDAGTYRYNGMPGMIRILAKKAAMPYKPPKPVTTLAYLMNPFPRSQTCAYEV